MPAIADILPAMRFRFPRVDRIRHRRQFDEVFALAASSGDGRLIVYAAPSEATGPRLGIVVGKRHGTAVRRNRKKRLLREAFRLSRGELPGGYDFVLVPRTGPAAAKSEYAESLLALAPKAVARIRPRRRQS
jgi:ribonuclease P protein component